MEERYTEVCGDNRFDLIKKYKERLIEKTNIETAKDEMNVIDSILFRFWQMGWLDRLEADEVPKDGMTPLEYKLIGVMHSVDKWLDGDELNQDEVNRAATMREKTLRIIKNLEADIELYKNHITELNDDKAILFDVNDKIKQKIIEQTKQDVAREIFEEIEKELAQILKDLKEAKKGMMFDLLDYVNTKIKMVEIIQHHLAELKKKYIGE